MTGCSSRAVAGLAGLKLPTLRNAQNKHFRRVGITTPPTPPLAQPKRGAGPDPRPLHRKVGRTDARFPSVLAPEAGGQTRNA
jgi:hypothetical protein